MNTPPIPGSELVALEQQIQVIYDTYIMGQKATAREMFKAIPATRHAYVAVQLYCLGQTHGRGMAMRHFIYSLTE